MEIVLPHRSSTDAMAFGLPVATMITWPVAMYGTASATLSRSAFTYSADQTTSQRSLVRSWISESNAVFLISSFRPSFSATARAASTSKPVAWFGSVMSAEAKNSIGEYSISTQSVRVPAVTRLVGGAIATSLGASVPGAADSGAVDAPVEGAVDAPPPPAHAATNKAIAANPASRWIRMLGVLLAGSRGTRNWRRQGSTSAFEASSREGGSFAQVPPPRRVAIAIWSARLGELIREVDERLRDLRQRRQVERRADLLAARPELGEQPHPLLEDRPRRVAMGEQQIRAVKQLEGRTGVPARMLRADRQPCHEPAERLHDVLHQPDAHLREDAEMVVGLVRVGEVPG